LDPMWGFAPEAPQIATHFSVQTCTWKKHSLNVLKDKSVQFNKLLLHAWHNGCPFSCYLELFARPQRSAVRSTMRIYFVFIYALLSLFAFALVL